MPPPRRRSGTSSPAALTKRLDDATKLHNDVADRVEWAQCAFMNTKAALEAGDGRLDSWMAELMEKFPVAMEQYGSPRGRIDELRNDPVSARFGGSNLRRLIELGELLGKDIDTLQRAIVGLQMSSRSEKSSVVENPEPASPATEVTEETSSIESPVVDVAESAPAKTIPAPAARVLLLIDQIDAIAIANTVQRTLVICMRQEASRHFTAQLSECHTAAAKQFQKAGKEADRLMPEIIEMERVWQGTGWEDILRETLEEVEELSRKLREEIVGLQGQIYARIREEGLVREAALNGRTPDVSHLVAIGTKAFVHMPKKKKKKLDPCSFEGSWSDTAEATNIASGSPKPTKSRFESPGMFALWARGIRMDGDDGPVGAHGNGGSHGDAGAQPKEPIIYDMIEVLPEPRAEPESESEEESESESESEYESGKESGENEDDISGDDEETIPRGATVEPSETPVSAPSLPQPQQPADPEQPRPQRVRKAPAHFRSGNICLRSTRISGSISCRLERRHDDVEQIHRLYRTSKL
jgi:hypothetical protein